MPPSALHYSDTKQKAIEDARAAQAVVVRECAAAGREPPPYELQELIGKGSFGRVYKAARAPAGQTVAVKIISLESEGEGGEGGGGGGGGCGAADSLSDIVREVNTLKSLTSSGARNINAVVDTLVVGPAVWMVTEYCAGGSVASLMRPTGGLPEKYIVPVLREVAEALFWVHRHGIVHRDIKCANVLVAEAGAVQLCDFGVAGILETRADKRHTVTGTLHWMAPELFDDAVAYGREVDVWAFGAMAFEVAEGLPPNAASRIDVRRFGDLLKRRCPRLEGDFSPALKDLVAFCLVDDPARRPPIERVQEHPYLAGSAAAFPTASLAQLVADYRLWESRGGCRHSLFSAGGARAPAPSRPPSPSCRLSGWHFNGFDDADWGDAGQSLPLTLTGLRRLAEDDDDDDNLVISTDQSLDDTPTQSHARRRRRRRRRPRPAGPELKAPLERVFDPHTISKYDDNARHFYGAASSRRPLLSPVSESALPSPSSPPGDCLIDLDAASLFIDMDTIKPALRPLSTDFSDYIETTRGRTQDWSFAAAAAAVLTPTTPSSSSATPPSSYQPYRRHLDSPVPCASPASLIELDDLPPASATSLAFDLDGGAYAPATPTTPACYGYFDAWAPGALPALPKNPSLQAQMVPCAGEDLRTELKFMVLSFREHLEYASDWIYEMSVA